MRQPALHESFGLKRPRRVRASKEPLKILDFFAGCGGFSEGAYEAGCVIHAAYESNADAIETFKANFPDATVVECELPIPSSQILWPETRCHIHLSPPCQPLSAMAHTRGVSAERTEEQEKSHALIQWAIDLWLSSPTQCESFSLEEVAHKSVLELFERVRLEHPARFAYAVFDFSELGVPQTRKRVLASTPPLISALLRLRGQYSALSAVNVWIMQPRGTWTRDSHTFDVRGCGKTVASYGLHCRPVTGPATTVLTGTPRPPRHAERGVLSVTRAL